MYWDGSDCLKYPIEVTEEACQNLVKEMETKAAILYESRQTGVPPTREQSKPEDWECKCCEYLIECCKETT